MGPDSEHGERLVRRQAGEGGKYSVDARGGMARVTRADLMQSNGIVHVTDAVSLPN